MSLTMDADLVMLGPPGAGKGTQAQLLTSRWAIPHIATGDIFRLEAGRATPLGAGVKAFLDRGELVPDLLAIDVIRARLSEADAQHGFVLDGFPRTVPQAEALDEMLAELNRPLDAVLYLQLDKASVLARLGQRAELEQRSDDRPDVVVHRIEVYLEQTAPLIDYYRRQGKLRLIDGSRPAEVVAAAIDATLSERN
jgi:adenylate kinase